MVKEGSSDYKKVRKRCSLTEWFFVEPEMVLLWHHCEKPFEAPLFLRVCVCNTNIYIYAAVQKFVISKIFNVF